MDDHDLEFESMVISAKISLSEYIEKLRSCLKEVIDNFIISSDNGAFISFFISAKPLTKFC